MDRARKGCDSTTLESLLVDEKAEVTPEDVTLFWERFVNFAEKHERHDWKSLPEIVQRVRQTYSKRQLKAFEMILGRLSLALLVRLEPHYQGERQPRIETQTFFHLGMLIHYIIGEGKEAYLSVLDKPSLAAVYASEMTAETGLFLTAVFWFETLSYHASKFRLLRKYYAIEHLPGLPGFIAMIPFLTEQFEIPDEEKYPSFARKVEDGEWFIVDDERRKEQPVTHSSLSVNSVTARLN
jgi:hypothetical protein